MNAINIWGKFFLIAGLAVALAACDPPEKIESDANQIDMGVTVSSFNTAAGEEGTGALDGLTSLLTGAAAVHLDGEFLAVNLTTGIERIIVMGLDVDTTNFSIDTAGFDLAPGIYKFYFWMAGASGEYGFVTPEGVEFQVYEVTEELTNSFSLLAHPIMGEPIPTTVGSKYGHVAKLRQLAESGRLVELWVDLDKTTLDSLSDPSFHIELDGGGTDVYNVNPDSEAYLVYLHLAPGDYPFSLNLYDGSLLVGVIYSGTLSIVEGQTQIGLSMVVPSADTNYNFATDTGTGSTTTTLSTTVAPGDVIDFASGGGEVLAVLSLLGEATPYNEHIIPLASSGSNYEGTITTDLIVPGDSVTWAIYLYSRPDPSSPWAVFAYCASVATMTDPAGTLSCNLNVLIGTALPVLDIYVNDGAIPTPLPVPGVMINTGSGDPLGFTSDGSSGLPEGNLQTFLPTGEYVIIAHEPVSGNESSAPVTIAEDPSEINLVVPIPLPIPDTFPPEVTISEPVPEQWTNAQPFLSWDSNEDGTVTLKVDGQVVTATANGAPMAPITSGHREISVEIEDASGNTGSASVWINVDGDAPGITISAPADESFIGDETPNLDFTSDEAGMATITRNGMTIASNEAIEANTPVSFSLGTLSEGDYVVTVAIEDAVGNVGTGTTSFTVDLEPPLVTIITPVNGITISESEPILSYEVNLGSETAVHRRASDTIELDGQTLQHVRNGDPLPFMDDGWHTVTVHAVDRAANKDSASSTFRVYTGAWISISNPVNGSLIATGSTMLEFTSIVAGWATVVVNDDTVYSNTYVDADTLMQLPVEYLAEGANTIEVTVVDEFLTSKSTQTDFTVDTIAPLVQIDSPPHLETIGESEPLLYYTFDEPGTEVVLLDDGTEDIQKRSGQNMPTLGDGDHSVTVIVTDDAGNAVPKTVNFTVDTTLPIVSISAPLRKAMLATANPNLVFYSSEAGTAVIKVNNSPYSERPVFADEVVTVPITSLPDGWNEIVVTVTDMGGNPNEAVVGFTVDTDTPQVFIGSPDGTDTYDRNPILSYTVTEAVVGTAVTEEVFVDGEPVFDAGNGQPLPTTLSVDAEHIVAVRVTDGAGNSSEDFVRFRVLAREMADPIVLTASRERRPTKWINDTVELAAPTTVVIPPITSVVVTPGMGNPERFLLFLRLGEVKCVYLGGRYTSHVDGLPTEDRFLHFHSPICGFGYHHGHHHGDHDDSDDGHRRGYGRHRAGDEVLVNDSISAKVMTGDPAYDVTEVTVTVEVVQ